MPFLVLSLAALSAHAAAGGQPVTDVNVSVAGGESKVFSARFFDSLGRPAVGERVRFANDVCGTFPGGGFFVDATTDASGLASTVFTAFNQGITCWLTASAGVEVRFNVLTYIAANAYLAAGTNPASPLPGQTFTITARARYGAYDLYDADITAKIVPGTISAAVAPGTANSGQSGSVTFTVTPDGRVGGYAVELGFRSKTQRLAFDAPASPWQDLWWAGPAQNGWGVNVSQHADALFVVIYAYDGAGDATWYVMSDGSWDATHTAWTGPLYAPRGAPFTAYDPAKLVVGAPVGSATLTMTGIDALTLDYALAGQSGRKSLSRTPF